MKQTKNLLTVLAMAIVWFIPSWVYSENESPRQEALNQLKEVQSLKCTFGKGYSAAYEGPNFSMKEISDEFGFVFDSIDLKNRTARIIGNVGAADVVAFLTNGGLQFLEETAVGNIMFTTVFPHFKVKPIEFTAVTSRHLTLDFLNPVPFPSQRHGTCRIMD